MFFRKSAITVDDLGFFACSGQVSDIPPPPPPITVCSLGGGGLGNPFWGWGDEKKYGSENVGTVGGLYEGKIKKNVAQLSC